jgi:hypothetical protein
MTGHGEGVCSVLQMLCKMSVDNKIKFRKHNIRDDTGGGGFGDDDADDLGDEFEGNADVADMINE